MKLKNLLLYIESLLFFLASTICYANGLSEQELIRYKEDGNKQFQLWSENLQNAKTLQNHEKLEALWLGLRNMHNRASDGISDEKCILLFKDIQKEMLSIPDHASHFVEQFENDRKRRSVHDYSINLHYEKYNIFYELFPLLPSPHTIQTLGNLLNDERDKVPDGVMGIGGCVYTTHGSSNADYATMALQKMKLRKPPVDLSNPLFADRDYESNKPTWKLWYEQVKAGTRSFSFEGQDVEYRFKKDGTWETFPYVENKGSTPLQAPSNNATNSNLTNKSYTQLYWIGGIISATALGLWWMKRKQA